MAVLTLALGMTSCAEETCRGDGEHVSECVCPVDAEAPACPTSGCFVEYHERCVYFTVRDYCECLLANGCIPDTEGMRVYCAKRVAQTVSDPVISFYRQAAGCALDVCPNPAALP